MVLTAHQELSPLENSLADFTRVNSLKSRFNPYENLDSWVYLFGIFIHPLFRHILNEQRFPKPYFAISFGEKCDKVKDRQQAPS